MKNSFSPCYRWGIFAICAGMYIISQFWRVSTAVIADDLSRDLNISPEMLGLLGGAFFYSFGLVQLPMGPLLDRLGPRLVISVLGCLGALSAVLFAFSGNVYTAILGRAGIGLGMAAVLMGSYKLYTTWFAPHEFATIAGLTLSIGYLGAMGATTPLALLSESVGWRLTFIFIAVITMLLAVMIYLIVRDHPQPQSNMPPSRISSVTDIFSGLGMVFGSSLFWRQVPLAFTGYGTLIVVQGLWGGPYLMHTYGMTKAAASGILLAIPIGVVCGSSTWGYISDKIRRRKALVLWGQGTMLLIFCSLTLHLPLPYWGLLLQFWLLGLTFSCNVIMYTQAKETFPLHLAGTVLTAINFFLIMGAATIQHIIGIIMSRWQPAMTGELPVAAYRWGFGAAAAMLAVSLLIYLSSRDTGQQSSA